MAGVTPTEGKTLILQLIYNQDTTDRGAGLELGLFTNPSLSEASVYADITQPTGTGYAVKTLTDGSWTVTAGEATYAPQTWTAGGDWTGTVWGYYIAAKGTTNRLLHYQFDSAGRTIVSGDSYAVDLSNTAD
jgi:hypothetical protein